MWGLLAEKTQTIAAAAAERATSAVVVRKDSRG